jgi:hypothetical protein
MLKKFRIFVCAILLLASVVGCGRVSEKKPQSDQGQITGGQQGPETTALADPDSENDSARRLIGYIGLESHIRSRAIEPGSKFFLNHYLTGFGYSFVDDLVALMGVDEANGQTSGYKNAAPTAVNMLLYDMVLNGFAQDLMTQCEEAGERSGQAPKYRSDFVKSIREICPVSTINGDKDVMRRVYVALNGFQSPESEFEAWFQFFDEAYVEVDPETTMKHKIYSATMNPHLLLVR